MKVRLKDVNDMVVSDEYINIMIVKKPKRRYRTIIKTFYKHQAKLNRNLKAGGKNERDTF